MKPLSAYEKELREDIKILKQLNKDLTDPRWIKPSGQKPYEGVSYTGSGVLRDPTQ